MFLRPAEDFNNEHLLKCRGIVHDIFYAATSKTPIAIYLDHKDQIELVEYIRNIASTKSTTGEINDHLSKDSIHS